MVLNPKVVLTGPDADELNKRIESVVITDLSGYESDRLQVTFFYRDLTVNLRDKIYSVSLGYDNSLKSFGEFKLGRPRLDLLNERMTISATPLTTSPNGLREQRTAYYRETTIGAIATKIAERNSLLTRVDSATYNQPVFFADQRQESDLSFLRRLSAERDLLLKVTQNKLILLPRGATVNINGEAAHLIQMRKKQFVELFYEPAKERLYRGVQATVRDYDNADDIILKEGEAPYYTLVEPFVDIESANLAIKAELNRQRRLGATISGRCAGDPDIVSGNTLKIIDDAQLGNTIFTLNQCVHTINGSGYTTQLEAGLPSD